MLPVILLLLLNVKCGYGYSNWNLNSIGTPPKFVQQPADTAVHEEGLYDFIGRKVNLILHCMVTGDPTPNVTWFRGNREITTEGIISGTNGSIGLNVTEKELGRAVVLYHCRATNRIGHNNTLATIRSRDAKVSYSYFGGFRDPPGSVTVRTRLMQSVALECAVNESNPQPAIVWYHHLSNTPVELSDVEPFIESVQGGRYLYFSTVNSQTIRESPYTCRVMNALSYREVVSGRLFYIYNDLPDNQFEVFMPLEPTLVATIGKDTILRIAAAYGANDITQRFTTRCFTDTEIPHISSRSVYSVPDPPLGNFIRCLGLAGGRVIFNASVILTFVKPPSIVIMPSLANLVRRNIYTGGPPIVLNCTNVGVPSPQVTWFYNGNPFSGSGSVTIIGTQIITISTPLPAHSGIYQCFVSNGVPAPPEEVQRTWFIEISQTSPLRITPQATMDTRKGYLLVRPLNSINVSVNLEVLSNPCPSVQWIFNGKNISGVAKDTSSNNNAMLYTTVELDHQLYTYNNPCWKYKSDNIYQFQLIINLLNKTTSGIYSALFYDRRYPSSRTDIFVTVPVAAKPIRVRMEIMGHNNAACLLANSTAIITCDLIGFPRPDVEFYHSDVLIEGSRISSINYYQISISNINNLDEGPYSCKTVETISERRKIVDQSPSTYLSYCTLPRVISVIIDYKRSERDWVIVCEVDGIPIPQVIWLKDNRGIVNHGNRFSMTSKGKRFTLLIRSPSLFDYGMYQCLANSISGGSMNKTLVVAKRHPRVVSFTGDITVKEGNRVEITCAFDGFPIPLINWSKNDARIRSGVTVMVTNDSIVSTLSISSVSSIDEGDYKCLGTNMAGSDSKTLRVIVQAIPSGSMSLKYSIETSIYITFIAFYSILYF